MMTQVKKHSLLNEKKVTIINSTHDKTQFPNATGILQINVKNGKREVSFKDLNKNKWTKYY